jgi:hypothetical protein
LPNKCRIKEVAIDIINTVGAGRESTCQHGSRSKNREFQGKVPVVAIHQSRLSGSIKNAQQAQVSQRHQRQAADDLVQKKRIHEASTIDWKK